MTQYYLDGISGSDASNGTSVTLAKLTHAGAEALSLAAGDTVNVRGNCSYRETHTTSHAGTSGNPITYLVDEAGLIFASGGPARLTGSNDDKTITRTNAINFQNSFRKWVGYHLDSTSGVLVNMGNFTDMTLDKCFFQGGGAGAFTTSGASQANHSITRCVFLGVGMTITHTVTINNTNQLIQNCIILPQGGTGIRVDRVGGLTINNCLIIGAATGFRVNTALAAGQVVTINNCIIMANSIGLQATATTDVSEDYNNLYLNGTARTNVTAGANDQAYPVLLAGPLLTLGLPTWIFGFLDSNSQLSSIAGTGVPSGDLYGITRAGTSSWGPSQFISGQRPVDAGESRGRRG